MIAMESDEAVVDEDEDLAADPTVEIVMTEEAGATVARAEMTETTWETDTEAVDTETRARSLRTQTKS